jgi:O-antigen/teichoic acid export membrane protein
VSRIFAVLVGYFHGLEALGYINLGFRVVDAVSGLFNTVTTRFGLPLFSSLRSEPRRLASAFTQSTRLAALVILPAFAGLVVTAPDVVLIVFGPRWLPAVPVLQILAAVAGMGFARAFVAPLLKALSRPGLLVVPALAALAVTVLGVIATAGTTAVWATAVWAMRTLVTQPIGTFMLARFGGLPVRDQFRPVAGSLLAAVLMIAVVALFRSLLPDLPALARLALSMGVGVVSYCGLVVLFDRPTVVLFLSFLGDALSHATGWAAPAARLSVEGPEAGDDA